MSILLAFAVIHTLALMSPGPDFVLIVRNSLLFGCLTGMQTAIGIGAAVSMHIMGCFAGIDILATQFPALLRILQLVGAAYLAAIGALILLHSMPAKKLQQLKQGNTLQRPTAYKAFRMGFLCNLLNPKAGLFFWTLWAQFIRLQPPLYIQISLAVYIVVSAILWFVALATLLSYNAVAQRLAPWQNRINRLGGLVLLGFALAIGLQAP